MRRRSVNRENSGWATSPELFDALNKEFGPFDLDPAATPDNAKCDRFFTIEDNGLLLSWFGRVFLNPPYIWGLVGDWVEKARLETDNNRADLVVAVLPARTEVAWFHDHIINVGAEIRFLRGRHTFIKEDGSTAQPRHGIMIVIWRAHE